MKELLIEVEKEIENRDIHQDIISNILKTNKDIINRRIIGGYASVDMIDREGQRIPISALKEAVPKFMENIYYRPITIFHSDVSIGRVIPKWTNPDTGELIQTMITDIGWFIVCEIREDVEIADKVWEEIVKGNIRSFSVAGSSKEKLQKQTNGVHYEQIKSLEFYEISACEVPVNAMSKFDVLWDPQKVSI